MTPKISYQEADNLLKPGKSTMVAVGKKCHTHLSEMFQEIYNDPAYRCTDMACALRTTTGRIQKWKKLMIEMGFELTDRHKNSRDTYANNRKEIERDIFNEYRGW